jgi:hypothetical protein
LREDFSPASDVDMSVEVLPGRIPGLGFFGYGDELANIIGRKVDLNTRVFSANISETMCGAAQQLFMSKHDARATLLQIAENASMRAICAPVRRF